MPMVVPLSRENDQLPESALPSLPTYHYPCLFTERGKGCPRALRAGRKVNRVWWCLCQCPTPSPQELPVKPRLSLLCQLHTSLHGCLVISHYSRIHLAISIVFLSTAFQPVIFSPGHKLGGKSSSSWTDQRPWEKPFHSGQYNIKHSL